MNGSADGRRLSLRLPATSANLGPGFDAAALALALYLDVDAAPAEHFSVAASGRGAGPCSALHGNLLLDTYADVWARYRGQAPQALALTVRNAIPLGMGCGSSAAARLAGVALASYYAGLGWSTDRMLDEAAALEHHPDNAAACCLGGFVVSGFASGSDEASGSKRPPHVEARRFTPPADWRALLVLPELPLATALSRTVLPESYRRRAVVENLQNLALLVASFALGDGDLLRAATRDQVHQPYRGDACPLLGRLLPLAGTGPGILSVTLSGAGSGILLLLAHEGARARAEAQVRAAAVHLPIAELLCCELAPEPARLCAQGTGATRKAGDAFAITEDSFTHRVPST